MIVVDTNVVSEAISVRPSVKVLEWMRGVPSAQLFTTAITEAELLFGIALLPQGRRRRSLEALISGVLYEDFAGRILPFDGVAAPVFAEIAAERRLAGRPVGEADARIAAIARSRGAALATRNTRDFTDCGVTTLGAEPT